MNVTLRQLRALVAVQRTGSFSRAAAQLGVTQSATSLSIAQLEAELGQRLLDRTTHHVQLTEVGANLVPTAARLIGEIDEVLGELVDTGAQRRGRVTLSSVPAVTSRLLPQVLLRCRERYPRMAVELSDDHAADVVRKVLQGEANLGLTGATAVQDDRLQAEPLLDDPFCLIVPRAHALARRRRLRWAALDGVPLVMLNSSAGTRQLVNDALEQAGARPLSVVTLSQPASIWGMVAAGLGASILPRLATPEPAHPGIAVVPLHAPAVSLRLCAIRRRDRSLSPAAGGLLEVLRECFAGGLPAPAA